MINRSRSLRSIVTKRRVILSVLLVLGVGLGAGYLWARSVMGDEIPWGELRELPYGPATRESVLAVMPVPTQTGSNYLVWEWSNGRALIQFDADGRMVGWGHEQDPEFGIKRVWRKLCLPMHWLPYFVELSRP